MTMILKRSNLLLLRVVPVVLALVAVKLGLHFMNWEFLTLNPIFSGIIGANVFLMGFLLSGVLSDFKESEKVPGELAAGLYAISDELVMLRGRLPEAEYRRMRWQLHAWAGRLFNWFHKKAKTGELLQALQEFNDVLIDLEQRGATPTQLNRIRLELNGLRKFIIRIHTIRETDFISSGYLPDREFHLVSADRRADLHPDRTVLRIAVLCRSYLLSVGFHAPVDQGSSSLSDFV